MADGSAWLVALTLALAITVGGRSTGRLVTFLGLYWMAGGLITLRFAFAIRPRRGARLGLAAVVGVVLVLLRDQLSGLADRTCSSSCWACPPS